MIGWSEFALKRHQPRTGYSFFNWTPEQVLELVEKEWAKPSGSFGSNRRLFPGAGEIDLTRKVVVEIDPQGFFVPEVPLKELFKLGIQPQVSIETRQAGEDPYLGVYADWDECFRHGIDPLPAKYCKIVCYSAEALLENGGTRTTDEPWEIVAVLASLERVDLMDPLTMSRNYLEKPGGTFSVYSAQEFAEAIYAHSLRNIKMK